MLSISLLSARSVALFFFFNDTATTEIYTLSLHDALPIWMIDIRVTAKGLTTLKADRHPDSEPYTPRTPYAAQVRHANRHRSEEHTSELQSRLHLVCRLLLEKKNISNTSYDILSRTVDVSE